MTPQHELVERVRSDLATDERVRGLWLTGSLATGDDDSFSDVDMLVVVREPDLAGYLDGWPAFAAAYRPLLARRLAPAPVFNHVLDGWLRWDVVVGVPGDLANLDAGSVTELFNHDGLTPSTPGEHAALEALPPVYAERGAVVRLHLACAGMFLPVARELLGEAHPFDLEAACWEHLRRHLAVDLPA